MEQANDLLTYLLEANEANEERLREWNDRIEDIIFGPTEAQLRALPSSLTNQDVEVLVNVSQKLHQVLLKTLLSENNDSSLDESKTTSDNGNDGLQRSDESIQQIIVRCDATVLATRPRRLPQLVRTVRNWLRMYLQIYPVLPRTPAAETILRSTFQNVGMLKLYLHLLEQWAPSNQPEMARHVGQALFYTTFSTLPPGTDVHLQSLYECILRDLDVPRRLLRLYVQTNAVGVALALTQNIHNLLGNAPQAANVVQEARVGFTEVSSSCPWIKHTSKENTDNLSLRDVWDALWEYCITDSQPAFPGEISDYRAEMVEEILRSLYALRIGPNFTSAERRLIPALLSLENDDPRVVECQRSVLTLLTEADGAMATVLVDTPPCMPTLLRLLETQIDGVVSSSRIDDGAAAALTPVLLTFYRFCQINTDFLNQTKLAIFPGDVEDRNNDSDVSSSAQSMQPHDAPEGTLRWKMIRLLTWPQSHVKRLSAEILWLVCDGKPQEFSRRVGMGNALPFLAAKGHAQLPENVFQ